ncbi:flagellar filament capping protein FliD [Novispirillum itersonii]|uniref:Flagellar hook-associated protein 2 n=1 Tax=Novispirillum itersonii TaxID=189 RepID=A0A7X0DNG4_NOVIT|nr:flagellar filament capping protein FliD [Novispirillum itersonii]MBB6212118.1 flagellar hook-associated protein 2 [Novispirillum itersonii]
MTSVSSTSSTTSATSYSQNRNDFDTDSLVEAAVAARLTRADTLSTKVSANETKIAAYQEMQTLLQTMQTSLGTLRSEPGTSGRANDAFRDRTAYVTSSTSTTASTILSATVADGTDLGTHSIEVLQIAKAERLGSGSVNSRTTALGHAGVFTLGTGSLSASVTVTATMTLDDLVTAINAQSTASGVKASVVKVSDGDYMLTLTAADTGKSINLTAVSGDDVMTALGVTDSAGDAAVVLQAAQPAKLVVDGVTVERSGNSIDDVIDGVSLTLYRAEEGNSLTLEVDNDLSGIMDQITALVEAYNAFREFVLTNQTTGSDGSADDSAVLFGDATLRSVSQQMQTILTTEVNGVSLADIGLSFDSSNALELDSTALEDALLNNFEAVQTLFSYRMESSTSSLQLLRHGDGPDSASFTLDVTVDSSGALTAATVGGNASLFTVSGSTITGAAGTAYDGLVFVYTGKTAQSISVKLSQGIADSLWQVTDTVADSYDGSLTGIISTLQKTNTDLTDRISTIKSNAETYRSYLLDKYARIEAKLAKAQSVLDLLEAINNAESSA